MSWENVLLKKKKIVVRIIVSWETVFLKKNRNYSEGNNVFQPLDFMPV